MIGSRTITLGALAVCLLFCASPYCAAQGTEAAATQTLTPTVYPAEPGAAIPTSHSPVSSEPILAPAPRPNAVVPQNTDIVTTPRPSSAGMLKTSVPGVSPAPVPDMVKKPITLEQALQVAFENSPQIQAALSQVEASRGVVDEANARFRPTFTASASSTRQGPESTAVAGSSTQAGLSIALPLDISRQLKLSSEMAEGQFQLQYLSMVAVSEQLIVDVKSAYYDLLRACGQQAVSQAAVDSAKTRLDNIRAKREEGTLPQFDVTSAEVELENLNQQLIADVNQVSLAQSALNGTLGVDVSNPTQIVGVDVPITLSSVDIPKSVDEAYARRPEIKSAQSAVTLSVTNVNLQKTGLRPSLALVAGPTYNFNTSAARPDNLTWAITATLSVPLWDGGATRARTRQADADVQSSLASLNQTKITVANQVRRAALNLQESALRTQTTSRAVSLAQDALSIATDRYDAGIAVLVEVTNAQSQLTQARFNLVNAQYDYALALAQLQRASSTQPELTQLQLLANPEAAR